MPARKVQTFVSKTISVQTCLGSPFLFGASDDCEYQVSKRGGKLCWSLYPSARIQWTGWTKVNKPVFPGYPSEPKWITQFFCLSPPSPPPTPPPVTRLNAFTVLNQNESPIFFYPGYLSKRIDCAEPKWITHVNHPWFCEPLGPSGRCYWGWWAGGFQFASALLSL